MNEIDKYQKQELAWNNKPVRNTEDEAVAILTPMFAMFPQSKADGATVAAYVMMLRDLDPQVLKRAVLHLMGEAEFLPTVAAIRGHVAQLTKEYQPGPSSHVDPRKLPDVPTTMFRLSDEEDKRQRMNQLRRTAGWVY